jgi:hypothetical protein
MSNDYRSIYDKLNDGEYKNTYPYPNASYLKKNGWDDRLKEEKAEYNRHEQVMYEKFKADALFDVGLENHPNKDAIYSYAWQEGHSSGYSEVYQYLSDISELFFMNGRMLNAHVDEKGNVHGFNK